MLGRDTQRFRCVRLTVVKRPIRMCRMGRPRHSNKHIERVIQHAESLGWTVQLSRGHAWGHLYCPHSTREGCIVHVWSTPRNPENHARHIR